MAPPAVRGWRRCSEGSLLHDGKRALRGAGPLELPAARARTPSVGGARCAAAAPALLLAAALRPQELHKALQSPLSDQALFCWRRHKQQTMIQFGGQEAAPA